MLDGEISHLRLEVTLEYRKPPESLKETTSMPQWYKRANIVVKIPNGLKKDGLLLRYISGHFEEELKEQLTRADMQRWTSTSLKYLG